MGQHDLLHDVQAQTEALVASRFGAAFAKRVEKLSHQVCRNAAAIGHLQHHGLGQRAVQLHTDGFAGGAMLNGIAANLDALHKLNEAIPDPQLSRAMDRMEKAGRSIAAVVEKTPDKARSVDRFARYYLPEVVKLMGTYAALEQNSVRGENAAQIEAELRRNAETTATAFENQLDALYSAEAMDISTDIEVLDSILKSQNLAK